MTFAFSTSILRNFPVCFGLIRISAICTVSQGYTELMPDSLTTFARSSLFNPDWPKSQRQGVDTESIAPTNSVEVQGSTQDSTTDAPPSTGTGKLGCFLSCTRPEADFFSTCYQQKADNDIATLTICPSCPEPNLFRDDNTCQGSLNRARRSFQVPTSGLASSHHITYQTQRARPTSNRHLLADVALPPRPTGISMHPPN